MGGNTMINPNPNPTTNLTLSSLLGGMGGNAMIGLSTIACLNG
jgi:hypothetical protein